jgi:hypothetical protein
MKYDVTRFGPGGIEVVTVDAEGGDEAAAKAHVPGTLIRGIVPSEDQGEPAKRRGRPPLQGDVE